jgi:hypothetical protein
MNGDDRGLAVTERFQRTCRQLPPVKRITRSLHYLLSDLLQIARRRQRGRRQKIPTGSTGRCNADPGSEARPRRQGGRIQQKRHRGRACRQTGIQRESHGLHRLCRVTGLAPGRLGPETATAADLKNCDDHRYKQSSPNARNPHPCPRRFRRPAWKYFSLYCGPVRRPSARADSPRWLGRRLGLSTPP